MKDMTKISAIVFEQVIYKILIPNVLLQMEVVFLQGEVVDQLETSKINFEYRSTKVLCHPIIKKNYVFPVVPLEAELSVEIVGDLHYVNQGNLRQVLAFELILLLMREILNLLRECILSHSNRRRKRPKQSKIVKIQLYYHS
jgi:hypothetical protein